MATFADRLEQFINGINPAQKASVKESLTTLRDDLHAETVAFGSIPRVRAMIDDQICDLAGFMRQELRRTADGYELLTEDQHVITSEDGAAMLIEA